MIALTLFACFVLAAVLGCGVVAAFEIAGFFNHG
jgi:hypothetical protein